LGGGTATDERCRRCHGNWGTSWCRGCGRRLALRIGRRQDQRGREQH